MNENSLLGGLRNYLTTLINIEQQIFRLKRDDYNYSRKILLGPDKDVDEFLEKRFSHLNQLQNLRDTLNDIQSKLETPLIQNRWFRYDKQPGGIYLVGPEGYKFIQEVTPPSVANFDEKIKSQEFSKVFSIENALSEIDEIENSSR